LKWRLFTSWCEEH